MGERSALAEELRERIDRGEQFTWTDAREVLRRMAAATGEWAGIPAPLDDFRLRVEDRYPYKMLETMGATREHVCSADEVRPDGPMIVNGWYSKRRAGYVYVLSERGRRRSAFDPCWSYTRRVTYWLNTAGASAAWDPAAEAEALTKLSELVSDHMLSMYLLTGTLLETSPRSGVTYVFRKNRPTVAMVPMVRGDDSAPMKVLTALCLHPIAFYEETWAGAMVPTDDVIAHLLLMRGDEALLWRRANHHHPESPEAGI